MTKGVINICEKNEIITLFNQGVSIRSISKYTGKSRNTIRKIIRKCQELKKQIETEEKPEIISKLQFEMCTTTVTKRERKRLKFTPEVRRKFEEIMENDERKNSILGPNKQKLTATLVHKLLVSQGFDIGLTTITTEFALYRDKHRECFIRQHHYFGDRIEYDFHQVKLVIGGQPKVYHQATISVPASNFVFIRLYHNEKIGSVIDSIAEFFEYAGGVFKEVVFDNMSPVVKRLIIKQEKQYTDDIIKLSNYYGFKIVTCNPRKGNEKGHVEHSGNTIRNHLFVEKYEFEDEEKLYEYVKQSVKTFNVNNLDMWIEERKYLLPKPKVKYQLYEVSSHKVDTYSTISVHNNHYSVPDKLVGENVIVHTSADSIIVFYNNHHEATHKRAEGSSNYIIKIEHYLNTFLRKPGALKNSEALLQASENLKNIYYNDYNMDSKKFIEDLISNKLNIKCQKDKNIKLVDTSESYTSSAYDDLFEYFAEEQMKQINYLFNIEYNGEDRKHEQNRETSEEDSPSIHSF